MVQMYATTAARSMLTGRGQCGLSTDILAAKSLQDVSSPLDGARRADGDGGWTAAQYA